MKTQIASLALLFAAACGGVNEDNFVEKYAAVACSYGEECDPTAFSEDFGSVSECEDTFTALMVAFEFGKGCTFNDGNAKQCLSDAKGASCDAELESTACDNVYENCPAEECAFTDDGECDEPEGTDFCDEGTDVNDCA
jgi:hypothetical protein